MGQAAERISRALRCQWKVLQLISVRLRHERPELLRQLHVRAGLRHGLATLLSGCELESVPGWRLGLLSGRGLHVGFRVPVGMDAIPLWKLGLRSGIRLGLATRILEFLVCDT